MADVTTGSIPSLSYVKATHIKCTLEQIIMGLLQTAVNKKTST